MEVSKTSSALLKSIHKRMDHVKKNACDVPPETVIRTFFYNLYRLKWAKTQISEQDERLTYRLWYQDDSIYLTFNDYIIDNGYASYASSFTESIKFKKPHCVSEFMDHEYLDADYMLHLCDGDVELIQLYVNDLRTITRLLGPESRVTDAIYVHHIEWDTEDICDAWTSVHNMDTVDEKTNEEPLPKELLIFGIDEEEVADYLSDEYGFCVASYKQEIL